MIYWDNNTKIGQLLSERGLPGLLEIDQSDFGHLQPDSGMLLSLNLREDKN